MRNPMDDPVFDPWPLGEEHTIELPSTHRPRRWRSAADSLKRELPARPVPRPRTAPEPPPPTGGHSGGVSTDVRVRDEPAGARESDPFWFVDEPADSSVSVPDGPEPVAAPPPKGGPVAPEPVPSRGGVALGDRVLPRVEAFVRRLRAARHDASVQDRTFAAPGTITVRFEPWRGPFDEDGPHTGSLELGLAEDGSDRVAAVIRLEAVAEPIDRQDIALSDITDAWLDSLLLELVSHTLRGT